MNLNRDCTFSGVLFSFHSLLVTVTVFLTFVKYEGASGLLHLSGTFWYALVYGLFFAFYKLETAKPL